MATSNNSSWPFIRGLLLCTEFIQIKAHMVFIYGDSVENILILTKDDMVYLFVHDKNKSPNTIKIETMCEKNIKTFTAGNCIVLALTNTGKVYCWNRQTLSSSPPVEIKGDDKFFVDIGCQLLQPQPDKYWAVSNDGQIFKWEERQVLNSSLTPISLSPILDDKKFISISCGGDSYVIAVTIDGKVYRIAHKPHEGDRDGYDDEIVFPDNVSIAKAVCGYAHRLALSDSGRLYVWGSNSCGELGIGSQKRTMDSPVQLKNHEMYVVLDVAALPHGRISVAMGQGGKVFIWGKCMGQNISTPLRCNLMSLSNALIYFVITFPRNRILILEEKEETGVGSHVSKAFDDTTTSDLIIRVHGNPIHVHKAILKIRSQYFRTMFQDHWKEHNQDVIPIDQFSYDVYKGYLNYLYTDKIDLPDIDANITELLSLADTYNEISLIQLCKNVIVNRLRPDNVMIYYNTAVERHDEETQKYCFKFALDHLAEVVETSSFMELEGSEMKPFIIKLVRNNVFKK